MKIANEIRIFRLEILLLFIGLITLLIHTFISPISYNVQLGILFGLVFLLGVPHGALDYLVDEQNAENKHTKFSIKNFIAVYMFRLAAFALLWIYPVLAFSLFMIISIFHFGETDTASLVRNNKASTLLHIAYGTFLFSILLLLHISEIKEAVPLIGNYIETSTFYNYLLLNRVFIVATLGVILVTIAFIENRKGKLSIRPFQLLLFSLLIILLSVLPLLLSFSFYFALWHSILSVRNILTYFKRFNNNKKFNIICNQSIAFSVLALVGMAAIYFVLNYFVPDMNLLFALLVLLSVLTLPHLTVMHSMYKNVNKLSAS